MSQLKKGALLSYINIALTNLIGLLVTPFIVRSLGDSEYGLYTLIGAFVGYISIMDLGLNNTIVRYVAKYRAQSDIVGERKFLGTAMIIYCVISLIVVALGTAFYFNIDIIFGKTLTGVQLEKAKLMMLILIFNLAFTLPGGAFTAIANAYESFVFPRLLSIIKYIIRSILVVVILVYGADSIGIVVLDTIVNLFSIAITFIFIRRKLKVTFDFSKPQKSFLVEIFSYSIWIFIFAIVGQLQWRGGQFVIGSSLGTKEVAVYAIGILLGSYYGAFSGAIGGVFLPRATNMVTKNANAETLTNMMIKIARYSLFSLMLIFIAFLGVGSDFITLWVGKEYHDAYYIAIIVMIGYTVPLIQTFANSVLEAKKLFKFKTFTYLLFLILGTAASVFLVKQFGIVSVIICIVLGWLVSQVVMNWYFSQKLELNISAFFSGISKGLFLVFMMSGVLTFFITLLPLEGWFGLGIKGSLIAFTYSFILFFIGMNKEEKMNVKSIFNKFSK